jgi:hypothetical protein
VKNIKKRRRRALDNKRKRDGPYYVSEEIMQAPEREVILWSIGVTARILEMVGIIPKTASTVIL